MFYLPENKDIIDFSSFDYIIDAVDTVTAKLTVIEEAKGRRSGNKALWVREIKLNPQMLEIADISKTSVCPLAKVMRYELKREE